MPSDPATRALQPLLRVEAGGILKTKGVSREEERGPGCRPGSLEIWSFETEAPGKFQLEKPTPKISLSP